MDRDNQHHEYPFHRNKWSREKFSGILTKMED